VVSDFLAGNADTIEVLDASARSFRAGVADSTMPRLASTGAVEV